MFTDLLVPKGPRAHQRATRPPLSVVLVLIASALIALPAAPLRAASIYWTDYFGGGMGRANLDGTGVQNLNANAWGVALDVAAGKMYTTKMGSTPARSIAPRSMVISKRNTTLTPALVPALHLVWHSTLVRANCIGRMTAGLQAEKLDP